MDIRYPPFFHPFLMILTNCQAESEIFSWRRDEFDAYSNITQGLATTAYNVFRLPFYYKIMLVLLKFEIVRIALELILMTGPSAGYRKGFVYLQSIKFSVYFINDNQTSVSLYNCLWLRLGRDFPTWAPINTTRCSHDLYLSNFCLLLVTGGDEWNLKTESKCHLS